MEQQDDQYEVSDHDDYETVKPLTNFMKKTKVQVEHKKELEKETNFRKMRVHENSDEEGFVQIKTKHVSALKDMDVDSEEYKK